MTNFTRTLLATALVALAAAPQSATAGEHPTSKTAVKAPAQAATPAIFPLAEAAGFKTLTAAVKAAGLQATLTNEGPFTVFAPTDEAFAKLPAGTLDKLLANPEMLKKVLLNHVVAGDVRAADVVKLKSAMTLNGTALTIDTTKGVKVGDAMVTKTDIAAKNGVIHVIDTVLVPSNL